MSLPGNFARNPGKNEATLIKTNDMNYPQANAGKYLFDLMERSMAENGPIRTNIVSAAAGGGTDALSEDVGLYGKLYYNLAVDPGEARINSLVKYMKSKEVMGMNDGIGENKDGVLQMLMYHSPNSVEEENNLIAQMNQIAQRKPEVVFGTLEWRPARTAMNKISFSKTSVEEYRRYLSNLSDSGVVEVFSTGGSDENTDEFGTTVSAAHLAMDEWMIRQGAAECLPHDESSNNLRRIAKTRGIEPSIDDEALYR